MVNVTGNTDVGGIDIAGILLSVPALIIYGIIIGIVVFALIYILVLKPRKDTEIFEFESFGDTVISNLEKTFRTEGNKSKAKLLHGFNNKLGNVNKWLRVKGEWSLMKYDDTQKRYVEKTKTVRTPVMVDGVHKKDKKGKLVYKVSQETETVPYDLMLFKIKGDGVFESTSYIIVDYNQVKLDPQGNKYVISEDVPLNSYGNAWITSTKGEKYVNDISFRKSIENNMTYTQNYAGKVVFVETQHAKTMGRIYGKVDAKKSGYKAFAEDTLVREGTDTDEPTKDET